MKITNYFICKVVLLIAIQQIGLLPAFSQSRKDQIEILFSQKDSLLQTLSKEREMAEKYKNEQEQLIISLKNNINEVEFKVTQANISIDEKNKNLKNLQNQIITLIDSVNSIKEKLDIIKNENLKNSVIDRPIFDNSSFNGIEISFPDFLIGKKTNRSLCSIYDIEGDIGFYTREDGHLYISGDHWGGKVIKTLFAENQRSIIIIHDVYNEEGYMGIGDHQLFFNNEGQLFELVNNEENKLYLCSEGNEFKYRFKSTDFFK